MNKKEIEELVNALEDLIGKLRRNVFASEGDSDLKKSEKYFLFMIRNLNLKGQDKPSEIARKLGVSMPAITHHMNSLEVKGYITRVSSKSDRRIVHITLSDKGKKALEALRKTKQKRMYALLEFLGEKDSKNLVEILEKLSNFTTEVKARDFQ